jgi:hypothetical protein
MSYRRGRRWSSGYPDDRRHDGAYPRRRARPLRGLFRLGVVAALWASTGCRGPADPELGKCDFWIGAFYSKPMAERIRTFRSYDLESQYEIFLCGNDVVHPPALYLAEPFGEEGAAAVPLLKAKLANAKGDLVIRDIIVVFREMKQRGTYDFSKDRELSELMIEKVRGMRYQGWKTIVQTDLNEILDSHR